MRARIERKRKYWEPLALAAVLPGVAGAVNASGFVALGVYTSHTSGNVARLGDAIAQRHTSLAWEAAELVGLFLCGAMAATALVELAHRREKPRYVLPLLLESFLLATFALLSIHSERHWRWQRFELTALLCFSMGLQNAMVTRLSGAVVRTTHLTGITTDLGIEAVRTLFWLRDRARGHVHAASPDLPRVKLHLMIFLSFLSGATAGPALYLAIGSVSLLLPVIVLGFLAALDLLLGLGHSLPKHQRNSPLPAHVKLALGDSEPPPLAKASGAR